MTSCPLSLKAIAAHNSSQRDIKHSLERISARIALQREKGKEDGKKKRRRERKKEKGKCRHHSMRREIVWFTYEIKRRNT
jgi:hypothetical protein